MTAKTIAAGLIAALLLAGCGGISESQLIQARLLDTCAQAHPDDAVARQICECDVKYRPTGNPISTYGPLTDPGEAAEAACRECVKLHPDDQAAQEVCYQSKYVEATGPSLLAALALLAAAIAALGAL